MGKRVFLVVIDGFGVGQAIDARDYGDEGSNTLLNLYKKVDNLHLPTLERLGLYNIDGINIPHKNNEIIGCYGKLQEKSVGKDTTTGHFEMIGIVSEKPMPTYPNGFPSDITQQLEKTWGTKIIGNYASSGTEIIKVLGQEHIKTKCPIVYTSADSVLQVATNIEVYPLEKLYKMCEQAREIMTEKNAVGRVIARPFKTDSSGEFVRINSARRDFALSPKRPNTMSKLHLAGKDIIAVGKIEDIFNGQDITKSFSNHTNAEALEIMETLLETKFDGLCFVNLVDTDMLFGHRNDIDGYAKALQEIDNVLKKFVDNFKQDDYLIITGDHGCDPTTSSTDHSRENTPFLLFSKDILKSVNLGTMVGFDTIGKYIERLFDLRKDSLVYDKIGEKNGSK